MPCRKKFSPAKTVPLLLFFLLLFSSKSFSQTDSGDKPTPPIEPVPKTKPAEDLSRWPGFFTGVEGGSEWFFHPNSDPSGYGGVKIGGGGYSLDLGYDHIPRHNGFAIEASGMLPVFRFPRPQKNEMKNYLRIYAEPGLGYRAGGGVGTYASAKAMLVLFSDHRLTASGSNWSPFIEVQQRFALQPGQHGDSRIMIGILSAICEHCGME
jgi:hypothetical protein